MRSLLLPLLFVMFVATPEAHAQGANDFAAFAKAVGKEVSIVDQRGLVLEGIVEAATEENVTLRVGATTRSLSRKDIARRSPGGSEVVKPRTGTS